MFSGHLLASFHPLHSGHKPSSNPFSFPYVTLSEEEPTNLNVRVLFKPQDPSQEILLPWNDSYAK